MNEMKVINIETAFFITKETKYLVFTFLLCESESTANLLDYQKFACFRRDKMYLFNKYVCLKYDIKRGIFLVKMFLTFY